MQGAEASLLDPEGDVPPRESSEIKQGVINIPRKQTKFLRVPGVVGQFGQTVIGDDNVSTAPVTEEDAEKIKKHFQNVEELDAHPTSTPTAK